MLDRSQPALPSGFMPVMLTSFRASGAVDYGGLARLTDFYVEAGAVALFANCLSSEMYELTAQERLAVTRCVVERAGDRVPVVATGTFGGPVREQADFIKRVADTGVRAVVLTPCQLVTPDEPDALLRDRLHELLMLTEGIPLGLYECPVPHKRLVNADLLADLLPTGRFGFLKDTCLDAAEVRRRLNVTQGYTFGLYDAYMVNAVRSLRAGAAGLCCIQGNYFPELIAWLCRHVNDADRTAEVDRVQHLLTDCMNLVHSAYPTGAKYVLHQRGLPISTFTRRIVEPLTPDLQRRFGALGETASRLWGEIR